MISDEVLRNQTVHRSLVRALAFPGLPGLLLPEELTPPSVTQVSPAVALICRTLLDREVTFSLLSEDTLRDTPQLAQLTYARPAPASEAQYIFVTSPKVDPAPVLAEAPVGTPEAPHLGATIVLTVEALGVRTGSGTDKVYRLQGPGIESFREVVIDTPWDWLSPRSQKLDELPLGIDIFFIDYHANVLGLPRTTVVESLESGEGA